MQTDKIICLGIESSCDETAAAVVRSDGEIVSHNIYSQVPELQKWGGVVPELAARGHILNIYKIVKKTLDDAGMTMDDIDIIAGSPGPGLIGGVIVGWEFATGLSHATGKPLIAVNHLEAHALIPRLVPNKVGQVLTKPAGEFYQNSPHLDFPYLLLLASGGHTQILAVNGVGEYELLGETLDDSAGESFDKIAKMLGLSYPGGPIVEELAKTGRADAFQFPRPLCHQNNCNFSFSGIKTAARTFLEKINNQTVVTPAKAGVHCLQTTDNSEIEVALTAIDPGLRRGDELCYVEDFCASFQQTVIDCIISRLGNAIKMRPDIKTLVVAGGVAANIAIRAAMEKLAVDNGMAFAAPPLKLCTDNGVMIAWAGIENYLVNRNIVTRPIAPRPRWNLTEI